MSTPDNAAAVSAFVFRLATAPEYSMRTGFEPGLDGLAGEGAKLLGKLEERHQLRPFFGRDGRKVERIDDGAVEQEIRDLLGNLHGDVLLRLARRCAEMRRADRVVRREQDVVGGWLDFIDVDRGAATLPDCSASNRAFSSINPPLAQLMMRTPSRIVRMASR